MQVSKINKIGKIAKIFNNPGNLVNLEKIVVQTIVKICNYPIISVFGCDGGVNALYTASCTPPLTPPKVKNCSPPLEGLEEAYCL